MTLKELATEVIEMFKLQQAYFKSRNSENLTRSKIAERTLREKCEKIASPPQQQQLFGQMKLLRVVSGTGAIHGVEFEVPADASEQEIAEAAWEAVGERISYGWEEVR